MPPPPVLLVGLRPSRPDAVAAERSPAAHVTSEVVHDDHVIVVLSGEFDRANVGALEDRLNALDGGRPAMVTLDLRRVTFVDVATTRGLLRWARRTRDQGVAVRIDHPPRLLTALANVLAHDVQVALAT